MKTMLPAIYPRVLHETHRKRFLHSPWVARGFVPKFPDLKVSSSIFFGLNWNLFSLKMVADLSHWVNVAETNADDPDLTKVIEQFAGMFRHTHCR